MKLANMADELSQLFSNAFTKPADSLLHPRLEEYKGRYIKSGDQDFRRKDTLNRQKQKRFDSITYARKLVDGELNLEDVNEISIDIDDKDADTSPTKSKEKRFNPYKNQLMLSEWVIDPPEDLENDWIMVVCPTGKRLLVVAHKGHTTAFTKSGYALNKFPSMLPGGSFKTFKKTSSGSGRLFTILDCVFDEINRTYWMLDIMFYKSTPLYECETDFRFFWLNTKLTEDNPDICNQTSVNPFKFKPCPYMQSKKDNVVDAVSAMYDFEIDGLLFYHRLCHYSPGRNPLVGWLKSYMIQDILGIPMPLSIMENAPVEFNKEILQDANKKLQNTVSDKSFNSPQPDKSKEAPKQDKSNEAEMEG